MKLEKIDLPRKYEYKEGVTNPLYERFKGWNKVSYSQLGSIKKYKAAKLCNDGFLVANVFRLLQEEINTFSQR